MKKTSIWLTEADKKLRDEEAAQLGISASEFIRRAMHQMRTLRLHGLKQVRLQQPASRKSPQSPQGK
jgi:hypothetical protein